MTNAEKIAATHTLARPGNAQRMTFRTLSTGKVQISFYTTEYNREIYRGADNRPAKFARKLYREALQNGYRKV